MMPLHCLRHMACNGQRSSVTAQERLSRWTSHSTRPAIIDAKLSPPFLRKSFARLRRAMPQARNVTLERSGEARQCDSV
jgi:hypothetical protein